MREQAPKWFAGIWCGAKISASFYYVPHILSSQSPKPLQQFFFPAESQFHCHGNLPFWRQLSCLTHYQLNQTLSTHNQMSQPLSTHIHSQLTHILTYSHLIDQLLRYHGCWNQRSCPHNDPWPSCSTDMHCALHAVVAGWLVVVAGGGGGTRHGTWCCPTTSGKGDTHTPFFCCWEQSQTRPTVWCFYLCIQAQMSNLPHTKPSCNIFLCSLDLCRRQHLHKIYLSHKYIKKKKKKNLYKYIFKIITRIMTMKQQTMNKRKWRWSSYTYYKWQSFTLPFPQFT